MKIRKINPPLLSLINGIAFITIPVEAIPNYVHITERDLTEAEADLFLSIPGFEVYDPDGAKKSAEPVESVAERKARLKAEREAEEQAAAEQLKVAEDNQIPAGGADNSDQSDTGSDASDKSDTPAADDKHDIKASAAAILKNKSSGTKKNEQKKN